MKNMLLVIGLVFTSGWANAGQMYHCEGVGGLSNSALVLVKSPSKGQLVVELKLFRHGSSKEDYKGIFQSYKTPRILRNGEFDAKGGFKSAATGAYIPATMQASLQPDPVTGYVTFYIHTDHRAGWEHRIESGYGLALFCKVIPKADR